MARRLVGAKPLSEPMLEYWIEPLGTKSSSILIKILVFIQENAFEYVCLRNGIHFV